MILDTKLWKIKDNQMISFSNPAEIPTEHYSDENRFLTNPSLCPKALLNMMELCKCSSMERVKLVRNVQNQFFIKSRLCMLKLIYNMSIQTSSLFTSSRQRL